MAPKNLYETVTEPRNIAISIGILGVGVALAARQMGIPDISSHSLPTEQALSAYSGVAGIGGFLAQILASRQLSRVQGDQVSIGSLAVPVLISAGATAGSAFLLPSQ